MKFSSVVVIATVSALSVATLSSCASSDGVSSTSKGLDGRKIGYVDVQAQGAMQRREFDFFEKGANLLGWKVKMSDAAGDGAAGLKAVQSFVAQKYDAIVVSCIDAGPLLPGLRAADRAKIPVLQVECPGKQANGGAGFTAVYAGPEKGLSKVMATFVAKQNGGKGEAAVLQDDALEAGRIRSSVVADELKRAGMDVVAKTTVPLNNIDAAARTGTAGMLTANPNLNAIVAVFDFFAGPAITAINAARREDVSLYSWYADAVNLPLMLKKGSPLKAVADTPVEQTALVAVDQLASYFAKGTPIDPSAASKIKWQYKVFTQNDHPELTNGYLGPWDFNEYVAPYVKRWNEDLGTNVSVQR